MTHLQCDSTNHSASLLQIKPPSPPQLPPTPPKWPLLCGSAQFKWTHWLASVCETSLSGCGDSPPQLTATGAYCDIKLPTLPGIHTSSFEKPRLKMFNGKRASFLSKETTWSHFLLFTPLPCPPSPASPPLPPSSFLPTRLWLSVNQSI